MPRSLQSTETALSAANLLPLARRYTGPFWAYDAQIIQARIAQLQAFDWCALRRRPARIRISCA